MQHPQHPEPQETQSPKNQKSPPTFTQIYPQKHPNPQKYKPKNTKKPELHLKGKPKIQIKPQIQKKSNSYSQEKEKTTVGGAELNQPEKLSDVAESIGKAVGGARARRRGPQHRRSNSQTSKNSLGHVHPQKRQ